MRRKTKSPLDGNFLCDFLNKVWVEGWLDSFSQEHFLICAMQNSIADYHGKSQLKENNANLYNYGKNIGLNFSINFSNKLAHLCEVFGEKEIKEFVENQLSAGKEKYDEDQFFRALTEVEILQFFSEFVYSVKKQCIYEPAIGIDGKNPEARFIYDNDVIVDVEVKTPGFSNKSITEKLLIPTVMLSEDGRNELISFCEKNNVKCLLPRMYKLIGFLNSAASKFVMPSSTKHFNLLYINWSYSEFPSKSFLEAYSILHNELTGLLNHKKVGLHFGISEDVYEKLSAVIVYTSSLNNLISQDFRYLWSTRNFSIIPINGDEELLAKITQMDYNKNMCPPLILADFKSKTIDEKVEEAYVCAKSIEIIKQQRYI